MPGSGRLLPQAAAGQLTVCEAHGIDAVFAIAAGLEADEVLAVGDGTTTLAITSALALAGRTVAIRPIRAGSDGWTEAAGVNGDRIEGGPVREVATLRVERLGCAWPIVCTTAAFGGVAPLLAGLHRGGSTASAAKDFALALGRAHGPTGWTESGAETPWGLICSASGHVGGGVSLESSAEGFVATNLEPARGGGLMGLVRGLAGILGGGSSRELAVLELGGHGTLALDGWVTEGPDRVRITRGPTVRIVG